VLIANIETICVVCFHLHVSPIATVAPHRLLCLTFPDFDLAPKRKSLAIADLIWYRADE